MATEQTRIEFLAQGLLHGGNDQGLTIAFSLCPCRFYPAASDFFCHLEDRCSPNLMKSDKSTADPLWPRTLQVQVLGSRGRLRGDLGVYLDSVEVVGVPGDDDIVPVVVVQRLV